MTRRVPWGPLVLVAALSVPAFGSRFYTFLANDVVIWALFATSLNLLVGYTAWSRSARRVFRHRRVRHRHPHEEARPAVRARLPRSRRAGGGFALLFGLFCVRLTRILLRNAHAGLRQIVWAICFK